MADRAGAGAVAAGAPPRAPLRFGTVVVIGGGCYGSYYVRQLQRAAAAGAILLRELLVVDRDPDCTGAGKATGDGPLRPRLEVEEWDAFLAGYLGRASADPGQASADAIVPSPLMPHLLYDWLVARARSRWPDREVRPAPVQGDLPVPWQRAGEDGTRYASFATWMCPINCIEPARCPHTREARDWSMPVALRRHVDGAAAAGRPRPGPYLFHCTHRAFGVGMVDVAAVVRADADLAEQGARLGVDAIVGTVSHCHGAVSRLVVSPPTGVAGTAR